MYSDLTDILIQGFEANGAKRAAEVNGIETSMKRAKNDGDT